MTNDDTLLIAAALGIAILAIVCGYLIAHFRARMQVEELRRRYAELNTRLDQEKNTASEKLSSMERMRDGLEQTLAALALEPGQGTAGANTQDGAFPQALLRPLQRTLQQADQHIRQIEHDNIEAQKLPQRQVELLRNPHPLGRGDPRQIAAAFANADQRRRWGADTVGTLVELAGMSGHSRFIAAEPGSTPTQLLIDLPGGGNVLVDLQTPLEAYTNLCNAPDASVRAWHLESHARKLQERLRELGSRAYLSRLDPTPTLVMQLALNDHYLTTALESDPQLLRDARQQNIAFATPSDVLSLLLTAAHGWRQQDFVTAAQHLRETSLALYKRFGTFAIHLTKLGNQLGGVLQSYNRAMRFFDSQGEADAPKGETLLPEQQARHRSSAGNSNSYS